MINFSSFFLFLHTADDHCNVSLFDDENILAMDQQKIDKGHAEFLAIQVQNLCLSINFSLKDVKTIFVNIGPGSFTGIRVGVSFARSLAFALDIPVYGITSLELLTIEMIEKTKKECENFEYFFSLIPAYHDYFYGQIFSKNLKPFNEARIFQKQEILDIFQKFQENENEKLLLVEQIFENSTPEFDCSFFGNKKRTIKNTKITNYQKIIQYYQKSALTERAAYPLYLRDVI